MGHVLSPPPVSPNIGVTLLSRRQSVLPIVFMPKRRPGHLQLPLPPRTPEGGTLPSQCRQASVSAMSGPFLSATGEMQTPRGKTSCQWEGNGSSIFHTGFLASLTHPSPRQPSQTVCIRGHYPSHTGTQAPRGDLTLGGRA